MKEQLSDQVEYYPQIEGFAPGPQRLVTCTCGAQMLIPANPADVTPGCGRCQAKAQAAAALEGAA